MTVLISFGSLQSIAWEGMPNPRLRVDGRYVKDSYGNIVEIPVIGNRKAFVGIYEY